MTRVRKRDASTSLRDKEHHPMVSLKGRRIDFFTDDAAQFNRLRDQWRSAAVSSPLSKVAHKIASLLPTNVNRELGYAFPTDEQLAGALKTSTRNVGKGMKALEDAGLIERNTRVKRDGRGEAVGRMRRIYLTLPDHTSERNTLPEVNGTPSGVSGPNCVSERNNGFRISPDRNTRDTKKRGLGAREGSAGALPRNTLPRIYGNDTGFLDAFDRFLIEATEGKDVLAGQMEEIAQQAFDATTSSSEMFMPCGWAEICDLNDSSVAEWFRARAGAIFRSSRITPSQRTAPLDTRVSGREHWPQPSATSKG